MEPLTVRGTLKALKAISNYAIAAAKAANLEPARAYNLRLAVDEIVTNIIMYGYQETESTGMIRLQADLDDRTLTLIIEDTGAPYDPTQKLPPPDLHLSFEQRQVGGLGLYLAFQGVDRFVYERVGDRNRNILAIDRFKRR